MWNWPTLKGLPINSANLNQTKNSDIALNQDHSKQE